MRARTSGCRWFLTACAAAMTYSSRKHTAPVSQRKLTGTSVPQRARPKRQTTKAGVAQPLLVTPARSLWALPPDKLPTGRHPVRTPMSSSRESTMVVSLWFTSDVIARSDLLGPGGTADDLIGRSSARASLLAQSAHPSIRHRRVDSWSPADNGPRATSAGDPGVIDASECESAWRSSCSGTRLSESVELKLRLPGACRESPLLERKSLTVTKATRQGTLFLATPAR